MLLCDETNDEELDQRSLWRVQREKEREIEKQRRERKRRMEADETSCGASESRICPARNPAVCAQIGCYLSAAGDRAHSGPTYTLTQPYACIRTCTFHHL